MNNYKMKYKEYNKLKKTIKWYILEHKQSLTCVRIFTENYNKKNIKKNSYYIWLKKLTKNHNQRIS